MKSILSGWGRYPIVKAEELIPKEAGQLNSFLSAPYFPRGLGRSYGDASLPSEGFNSLNTAGLNRFLSFNPATGFLDAEAGVTLQAILSICIPRGFFLPVTPGTRHVSLGGALASNVHGKNHHHCGSIENFVIEMEVATENGIWVCSPTLKSELYWATLGGYGMTGMITRAKLKLKPIRSNEVEVLKLRAANLKEMFELFERYDRDFEYSVAWLDTLAKGKGLGRGVLMLGKHDDPNLSMTKSNENLKPDKLVGEKKTWIKVPFSMPAFFLNRPLLSVFNKMYYGLAKEKYSEKVSFRSYFYPLDGIGNWNRLYGRKGFLQYQLAIPDPHGPEGISACLQFISDNGLGSFLSVLKRCGDDTVMLPFCKRGYTLAMDIPFRSEKTLRLLDRLDQLVIQYLGRVYLTKDARLSPSAFRSMYPEFETWMTTVKKYNSKSKCNSRMADRLQLWNG